MKYGLLAGGIVAWLYVILRFETVCMKVLGRLVHPIASCRRGR